MADDGMLFNFDTSATAAAVSKPKIRGGHWRDRLKARKSADAGGRASRGRGGSSANHIQLGQRRQTQLQEDGDEAQRAAKRQRVEASTTHAKSPHGLASGGREVVSSLFTSNPKPKSKATEGHGREMPDAAPSNAPLPEGAANFISLSLSATLATHLLTKMDLKAPTAIQQATVSQLVSEDADAFIQAETGSGKTLAYLLPIIQRLMTFSDNKDGQMHRDSGLFAIILAPTRELCRQIQNVLDSLLRCAHWIVAGSVTGGERKKSEKARLRKGINILVATPGRLADHLQNTTVLDVSNVRWLVMDEGDRLMELGFEQDIKALVEALDKRAAKAPRDVSLPAGQTHPSSLPKRRVTILCSATMKMNVQKLGEASLKDAVHIKAETQGKMNEGDVEEAKFMAPAQMKQSYIVVPAKQRLVALAALLRKTFARRGSVMKAIVFLSCADSVDFHFECLRRGGDEVTDNSNAPKTENPTEPQQVASPPTSPEPAKREPKTKTITTQRSLPSDPITSSKAPLLASVHNSSLGIFRLHGSLSQPIRTSTLRAFSKTNDPAIMLCTDVASRGLDLPSIDLVIEFDPAFSAEDHLHRVGRTARAGKEGRAILFLMPGSEEGYVEVLEKEGRSEEGGKRRLGRLEVDDVLKRGFAEETAAKVESQAQTAGGKATKFVPSAGSGKEWEQRATDWQLEAERWALATENRRAHDMAEKAYKSSVAAYATHVKPERHMFDVSELHLGHLAKAFALRDKPSNFGRGQGASKKRVGVGRTSIGGRESRADDAMNDDDTPRNKASIDEDVMAKMRKLARAREADQAGEFNFG